MALNIERVDEDALYHQVLDFVKTLDGTIVTTGSVTRDFINEKHLEPSKRIEVQKEVGRVFRGLAEYGKIKKVPAMDQFVIDFTNMIHDFNSKTAEYVR